MLSLAEGEYKEEVVGCVEGGVRAAEWSPDDEQVVLVTGEYGVVGSIAAADGCRRRRGDAHVEGL